MGHYKRLELMKLGTHVSNINYTTMSSLNFLSQTFDLITKL